MRKQIKVFSLSSILATIGILAGSAPVTAQEITVIALPNPIELPEILFILALMGFAFWKRSWLRLMLAIPIIIWGVFAAPYDMKIGVPVMAIGTILFFMALMKVWRGKDIEVAGRTI